MGDSGAIGPQPAGGPYEPAVDGQRPAWQRPTRGEPRWPVVVAVLVAVTLQLTLPDRLALHPHWLLPGLEVALMAALTAANPVRVTRESTALRVTSTALVAVVTLANAVSAALLVRSLLTGHGSNDPGPLLASGAAIYVTNVVAFSLWYWELDRGGPAARAAGRRKHPDFLFAQMSSPGVAPPEWEPRYADYLYLSFTNVTAFSPTDTLPLVRWAKMTMLAQSVVALSVVTLVVARAVNVLK